MKLFRQILDFSKERDYFYDRLGMLRRLVYTFIALIALFTASYGQIGYKLELNSCVNNDTLFIDFQATDTTSGGWAFSTSNFVIDIVSGTSGLQGSGLTGLDFANRSITFEGPWGTSNAPDYAALSLGADSNFINLTIQGDELNGATGFSLVTGTTYEIGTVAIPLNGNACGDTISLKWRYKSRGPDHTWEGKMLGFGSGDINQWGQHPDSSIQDSANFIDLLNITLCDCGKAANSYVLTASGNGFCAGDSVTYSVSPFSAGDSMQLFKIGSVTPFATVGDSTYRDTIQGNQDVYAVVYEGCPTCGVGSDTLSLTVNPSNPFGLVLDTIGCDSIEVFARAGWDSLKVDINGVNFTTLLAPDTSVILPIIANDLIAVTAIDTGLSNTCPSSWFIDTLINSMPEPPVVNIGLDTTICLGDSAILDAGTFAGAATYSWNQGAGGVTQLFIAKPIVTDTFEVAVDSLGCVVNDSIIITVISCNITALFDQGAVDTICLGDAVTYTNTSTNDTGRVWDFGGSFPNDTANGPHIISYNNIGWNFTELTVYGVGGLTDIYTDSVFVQGIQSAPVPSPVIVISDSIAISWPAVVGADDYTVHYSVNGGSTLNTTISGTLYEIGGLSSNDSICYHVVANSICNSISSDTSCVETGASNCDINFFTDTLQQTCYGDSICFALSNIQLPVNGSAWKISWEGRILVRDSVYCIEPPSTGNGNLEFTIVDTTVGSNCYSNGFLYYEVADTFATSFTVGVQKVTKSSATFQWQSVPNAIKYEVFLLNPPCHLDHMSWVFPEPNGSTSDSTATTHKISFNPNSNPCFDSIGAETPISIIVRAIGPNGCDTLNMQDDTITVPATDSCIIGYLKIPDVTISCALDTALLEISNVTISYQGNTVNTGFQIDWDGTGFGAVNDTDYAYVPIPPNSTIPVPFTISADVFNPACPYITDTINVTTGPPQNPFWSAKTDYCLEDKAFRIDLNRVTQDGYFVGTGVFIASGEWFFDPSVAGLGSHNITYYVCGDSLTNVFTVHDVPCVSTVFSDFNSRPDGIFATCDGVVYFSDTKRHSIWKIDTNGVSTKLFGDDRAYYQGVVGFSETGPPASGNRADIDQDGHISFAKIAYPKGLAVVESTGVIYFNDTKNHKVKMFDPATDEIRTVVGPVLGAAGDLPVGTTPGGVAGSAALLNQPWGMTKDCDNNNLYIIDAGNRKIRRVEIPDGGVNTGYTVFNSAGGGAGGAPGAGLSLNLEGGIWKAHPTLVDSFVYVMRQGPGAMYQYNINSGFVDYFMPISSGFFVYADGLEGGFDNIQNPPLDGTGTAFDPTGAGIYFSDNGDYSIRSSGFDDTIRTVAGSPPSAGPPVQGDAGGPPFVARFGSPTAMSFAANNALYICDFNSLTGVGSVKKAKFNETFGYFDSLDSVMCLGAFDTLTLRYSGIYSITSGDPAALTALSADTYLFAPLDTGWYTLRFDGDIQCCPIIDTFQVYVKALPELGLPDTTYTCDSSSTVLDADTMSDWISYQWQNLDSAIFPVDSFRFYTAMDTGFFAVTVTDSFGCVGIDTTFIDFSNPPPLSILSNIMDGDTVCYGSGVFLRFDSTNFATWSWNTGDTNARVLVDSTNGSGDYILTAVDSNNCAVMDTFRVIYRPLPDVCINSSLDTTLWKWNVGTLIVGPNLSSPWDVKLSPNKRRLWVSLNGSETRIIEIDLSDTTVSSFAGATSPLGTANLPEMRLPANFVGTGGIVTFRNEMYVSTSETFSLLQRITVDSAFEAAGNSFATGFTNGIGLSARFNQLKDMDVDPFGNIYIADFNNHQVRVYNTFSRRVTAFAGSAGAAGNRNFAMQQGLTGNLNWPWGICRDVYGNILVAEDGGHVITRIDYDTNITTLAGIGDGNAGFQDGPVGTSELRNPWNMITCPNGNTYFTEGNNHAVRTLKYNNEVETIGGTGVAGFVDGFQDIAQFRFPMGIDADPALRKMYVADRDNNAIRTVTLIRELVLCEGQVDTLDASCSNATVFSWVNLATGATSNTPIMIVDTAGEYVLTIRDANGCSNTDTVFVRMNPAPIVNINAGFDSIYACEGDTVSLYDTVGTNERYDWSTTTTFIDSINTYNDTLIQTDSSGTYFLEVTDTIVGCSTRDTIEVIYTPTPSIVLGNDTGICFGDSVFLPLTSTVSDSIIWNDTLNASVFVVSALGIDTIWATTFSNGCTFSDTIIVGVVQPPFVDINNGMDTMYNCVGTTTTLLDSLGSPNEVYLWSGTNLFNGLVTDTLITTDSSGTYYLEVTDTLGGCTSYDTIEVIYNPIPNVNLGADTGICFGDSLVFPNSVSSNDSIVWNDTLIATSYTVSSLGTDTIWATVYLNGCTYSDTIIVNIVTAPVVDINAGSDTIWECLGVTAVLFDTVGSTNEVYQWTGTNVFTGLVTDSLIRTDFAGTYYLEVTDTSAGCTSFDTIEVIYSPAPVIDLGPDTGVCFGDSLVFNPPLAGADSIVWNDTLLATGPYVINSPGTLDTIWATIYLGNCSITDTVVVAVANTIVAEAGVNTNICAGTNVAIGGTPTGTGGTTGSAFSYNWIPASFLNDSTLSNPILQPGAGITTDTLVNYKVIVTDTLSGCTEEDSMQATLRFVPVVDLGPDTIMCKGGEYSVDLSYIAAACPTCATPQWSSIGFAPEFVHVLDESRPILPPCLNTPCTIPEILFLANGTCFYTDTINLTFAAEVNANIDTLPVQCYQDFVNIGGSLAGSSNDSTASGGTGGPYTYQWLNLSDPTLVIPDTSNPLVQMLGNNTCYELIVIDRAPACRDTITQCFNVTIPPQFVNSDDTTLCRNDTIPLRTTFTNPVDPIAAGLTFGWTSVTGGIVDPNVTNTLGYPGPLDVTTSFLFQVLDGFGCTTTGADTVTVTINEPPIANFSADTVCNGESMVFTDLSANGTDAVNFWIWNFGDNPFSPTGQAQSHSYSLNPNMDSVFTVTLEVWSGIQNVCKHDTSFPVLVYGTPSADAGISLTYCPNIPIQLMGSPTADSGLAPYLYNWYEVIDTTNPITFSNTEFGADTTIFNPTVNPNPADTLNTYVVEVTDANGCIDEDTVLIYIIDLLAKGGGADAGGIRDTIRICRGDDAELGAKPEVASGGTTPYTYLWTTTATGGPFNSSDTIPHPFVQSSVDVDDYYLRVDDNAGCFDFDTVTVVKVDYPGVNLVDTNFCFGESVEMARGFSPEPNVIYSWNPNLDGDSLSFQDLNWVVRPLQNRDYILTATNLSVLSPGCVLIDTISLIVDALPVIDLGPEDTLCINDTLFFNPSVNSSVANSTHIWTMTPDPGLISDTSIRNPYYVPQSLNTNRFYLTVIDSNSCVNLDSVDVIMVDIVSVGGLFDTTLCSNELLDLSTAFATGRDSSLLWTTSGTGTFNYDTVLNPIYTPDSTLVDTLILSVSNHPCPQVMDTSVITLLPFPDADFVPDPFEIFIRDTVYFANNNTIGVGGTYTWVIEGDTIVLFNDGTTASTDTIWTYTLPGSDNVTLITVDTNFCRDTAYHTVEVIGSEVLFVPNVFSPSAQHVDNQSLRVFGTNIDTQNFEFQLFNRWGERILFETDFLMMNTIGWDGSVNGKEQKAGVYTYTVSGEFVSGRTFDRVGNVTLIR